MNVHIYVHEKYLEPSLPNHYLQMLNLFPLGNYSDILLPCYYQ